MTQSEASHSSNNDRPIMLRGALVLGPDSRWEPKSIVLAGREIQSVISDASPFPEAMIVDVSDTWVMPGLIDAHVHLGLAQGSGVDATPEEQQVNAIENSEKSLQAGVTTVRDLGSSSTVNIDIARDVESARRKGPRVVPAGQPITSPGGHLSQIGSQAQGISGLRHAVREQITRGARCIKLVVSGDALEPDDNQARSQFSFDEIEAAVEEAHRGRATVSVHAHGSTAIRDSLRAGVDSVEHATFLDDWSLDFLEAGNRSIVPTLAVYLRLAHSPTVDLEVRRKAREVLDRKIPLLRDAIRRGVNIGVGSDAASHFPHGAVVEEMEALLGAGLTRESVLEAATSGNAALLGIGQQVGTVEAGKAADLLISDRDPRDGFEGLKHPRMVVRAGELFEPPARVPVPWSYTARRQP